MKQKYFLTFLSVFIFFSISVFSQEYTGSLLWKISGNGLQKPSYIIGTHHLASLNYLDSIPRWQECFDEADLIIGELMVDQAAMESKMQHAMLMPETKSFRDLLSTQDYQLLDSLLQINLGAGLDQLSKVKPSMLTTLYSLKMYQEENPSVDLAKHQPMDMYFQLLANEKNKGVLGLESVEDQIYALFDATPLEDQAKSLLCILRNPDYYLGVLKRLEINYREADLTALAKMMTDPADPCPTSQYENDVLNKNRNNKWLLKLPQIMQTQSSFIAVGCLHIAGEDGLLAQLSKKGYTIEVVR